MKLIIPKDLLNMSNKALVYFLELQLHYRFDAGKNTLFSGKHLNFYAYNDMEKDNDALNELVENKIIKKIGRDEYEIIYRHPENNYEFVYSEEYYKIKKKNTVKTFISIIESFDYNISISGKCKVIGHNSIEMLAERVGTSEITILRHIRMLEECNLIYVVRSKYDRNLGTRRRNIYGRYSDKALVDKFAPMNQFYDEDYDAGNKDRSVSQRYNHFVKVNGEGFTEDEIIELYDNCLSYNENHETNHKNIDFIERYCTKHNIAL